MARRNQGPRLKWHRSGSGWYICWNEAGRYFERSTGTKDSEEAQIVFAEWMQARQRKHGPSDPAKTLVTDVLNLYAAERGPNVVEPRVIGCAIDALSRYWEGQTVVEVDKHTTELYAKKRALSPGTVRRELSVLRAAINYAFHRGMLTRAVWVQLPPAPPPRDRWLTRQEAAHLLRAACTKKARFYLPLFILIGLYTGRRSEAILSLRWPQVDLERGLINFDLPEREQTDKRRGIVRIPPRLLPHLRRARRRGTDLGYVVHDGGKHIGTIRAGFEAACRRAGIEGVTPHTLRHTAASWLMQAGISAWDAGQFLSMSVETLHRIYAHHSPESMQRAANALSGKRFRVISR